MDIKNIDYWTELEIKEINKSLKEYKDGKYKSFSDIDKLLKELHMTKKFDKLEKKIENEYKKKGFSSKRAKSIGFATAGKIAKKKGKQKSLVCLLTKIPSDK